MEMKRFQNLYESVMEEKTTEFQDLGSSVAFIMKTAANWIQNKFKNKEPEYSAENPEVIEPTSRSIEKYFDILFGENKWKRQDIQAKLPDKDGFYKKKSDIIDVDGDIVISYKNIDKWKEFMEKTSGKGLFMIGYVKGKIIFQPKEINPLESINEMFQNITKEDEKVFFWFLEYFIPTREWVLLRKKQEIKTDSPFFYAIAKKYLKFPVEHLLSFELLPKTPTRTSEEVLAAYDRMFK